MAAQLTARQRELVDRLAQAAIQRPPGERAGFVEGAGVEDAQVVREVLRLIRDADASMPLEAPGVSALGRALGGRAAPGRIGPYHVLGQIGEGGFGVVYLAERREPFVQRVALKVIKPGMDSAGVVARFEQERQALAVMDHPNVARVHDAGTTDDGRPYFVMEHVRGEPISDYCDRHGLSIRERIELFIPVCEAIQHAHHKGIIHRDVKPSNILVGTKEDRAVPKVIDFGVAKAIGQTLTDRTIFTEHGQIIGTPEYMSPEQAEMGAVDVDTRTDIYSLGVVLYELLSGCLPFDPRSLRAKGYDHIRRIIREVDPPKPSTRLSALARPRRRTAPEGEGAAGPATGASAARIAETRRTDMVSLTRVLRSELDWIPLRAMHKDRTRRYASAMELARDLRAYLDGRPLEAGPDSAAYRVRKYARRHRVALGAGLVVALALIGGTVVSTVFALREARAHRTADLEREQLLAERRATERTQRFIGGVAADLNGAWDSGLAPGEVFRVAGAQAGQRYADDPEQQARVYLELASLARTQAPGVDPGEFVRAAADAALRLEFAHPRLFKVFVDVTRALTLAGELDRAGAVLDRVPVERLAIAAQVANHHQLRADIAAARGDEEEARRLSDLSFRTLSGTSSSMLTADAILVLRARQRFLLDRRDPRADEPLRLIVAIQRTSVGDGTPELAASLHDLGRVLVNLGRAAEAVPVLEEALEIRRRVFGNERYPGVPATRALLERARLEAAAASPGASPEEV